MTKPFTHDQKPITKLFTNVQTVNHDQTIHPWPIQVQNVQVQKIKGGGAVGVEKRPGPKRWGEMS